jgi:hypothetical protein
MGLYSFDLTLGGKGNRKLYGFNQQTFSWDRPAELNMKTFTKGYKREHFLADLINREGLKRVAELGVWRGRTFLHVLANCPGVTVIGVDAWKKRPQNMGIPGGETYDDWDMETFEKDVRTRAAVFGERAIIHKMETDEAAKLVEDGSLDLVFIDADHSEEGVRGDITAWTPKIRSGGFITGHDINLPTVCKIVEKTFPNYQTGPENVWWARRVF